jgi:hypothetical protein
MAFSFFMYIGFPPCGAKNQYTQGGQAKVCITALMFFFTRRGEKEHTKT